MNNICLGIKFTLGFGAILLMTLFLGVTGYRALALISVETDEISSRFVPQLDLANRAQERLHQTEILFAHAIRTSNKNDIAATAASLDELSTAFKDLRALSAAQPGLTSLATFVRDTGSLLQNYTDAIRNALTLQKNLFAYRNTMNVAAASLERGVSGLSGSFMGDIAAQTAEGGEELRGLLSRQYSVSTLQLQIQTMRREVQQAILNRSPDEVTSQLRRIPDLQSRFMRLKESIQHPDRKQALLEATKDLETYLADLGHMQTSFVAQTQAIERQRTLCASLLEMTMQLADKSSSTIKGTTNIASVHTKDTTKELLVIFMLTALLTFVIAILTTRGVTVPIRQGMAFAAEVARGAFNARWETSRRDEFGALAASLNTAFVKVAAKAHWYESVLHSVPFSISVTDMDMKWTFMNSAGLKSIGRAKQADVLGHPCAEKGGSLCATQNCGILSLRRGQPEVTDCTPDGRTLRIQLNYLDDSAGKHIGHVEIGRDITDEVRLRSEAANALIQGKHETAEGLEGVAEALGNASVDLSEQIGRCDTGAANASVQLMKIASAMKDMNSTVLEVARNSAAASELSMQARSLAQEGSEGANTLVSRMDRLYQSSLGIKSDMQELGRHAEAINQIMGVISDIADQTNLLALNAAIEAARAGEAGRGFAVVADEVRKLAEKTMASTGNVAQAIKSIQESARKNISGVEQTAEQIAEMTALTKKSDQSLIQIVQVVETTSDQIRIIATASEQQSSTSESIKDAIVRINSLAEDSVAAMGTANGSVKMLVSQSDILRQHIVKLKH